MQKQITDMFIAAVVKTKGARFLGAEPDGDLIALLFDDTDGVVSQTVDAHKNGGIEINSATLAAALVAMKDEVFGARRQHFRRQERRPETQPEEPIPVRGSRGEEQGFRIRPGQGLVGSGRRGSRQ